ncbi:unnamed protein product [Cyprideis torosa]|uniref:Angiotensin-converting enzyme n=1 Tax=Cyprideis torosa TaxID=163714 RepID=A0A7R8W9F0_9CRUS|nr:unnamed protein product [Cyprideis torosa]CAG0887268.1 unnamed protein product [Cyprideis torosa]
MCTSKNMGDFITVHHEMGHIQYFLQYQDQPILFREGANPGFHEAVGDLMSLSVSTPSHLEGLGLYVPPENMTEEEGKDRDLNFLMDVALQKIAFLPFGYVMDKFRWDLFSGATDVDTMNSAWWDLRNDIQGVASPVDRTEEDFDPGCKYHTIANVPYIRYFVAHILQFSFHKAMCIKTGYYNESNPDANPLYLCDISNNTNPEVGETLSSALRKGYSQHWTKTLEELTGSSEMSAEAILEYFKPLDDFLNSYIAAENVPVGWPKVRDGGTINTATTEDPDGGEQDDDEDDDETIPIVIGVSIGAIALVILVVYFILKQRNIFITWHE